MECCWRMYLQYACIRPTSNWHHWQTEKTFENKSWPSLFVSDRYLVVCEWNPQYCDKHDTFLFTRCSLMLIFSSSHCAFVYLIHLALTHAPFIYTERRTTLSLYWSKVSTLLKLNAYVFLSSYRNQRLEQPLATMHNPSFSTANSVLILMITSWTKSQRCLNKCR